MKLVALLVVPVLLVACAEPAPRPLPVLSLESAQQMPAADLCLGLSTFRPSNAAVARQEIDRRGINCQDHAAAMQALQQRRAQEDAILLQRALMPQPTYQYKPYQLPMPTTPRQTVCTTERIGNQLQTVCR